ncbi:MAG: hypothetical protein Pg6A_15240 [Termitinemataceae bacterium]|nr:MAG: hypothetical protein Pg6A_15240 [Termitinemataceae bacterium]
MEKRITTEDEEKATTDSTENTDKGIQESVLSGLSVVNKERITTDSTENMDKGIQESVLSGLSVVNKEIISTDRKILYEEESYRIRSCIYEVNKKLGSGFLEAVYQEALEIELTNAGIPFEAKKELVIIYDGKPLHQFYIADFVCYDKIIVELKAVNKITNEHKAQIFNYLSVTGLRLGLLVNFHSFPKAEIIRIIK